jgi:hypothetical protein
MSNAERPNLENNQPIEEESTQTLDRFIKVAKRALSEEGHALDVEWEHQMNMLFGDEELMQVTKNKAYKGVPRVKEDLQFAYDSGGLILLRAVFLQKVVEHTDAHKMGTPVSKAVEKILKFE